MEEKLIQKIQRSDRPFLVAGPCSAESAEQMEMVARDIALNTHAQVLRAGIWKPRTRPDSFEGVGQIGLPWLVEAAKNNGLLSTTEVANAKHVELILKAGVDIAWIGARTTVNPFAVQEIADALKGSGIPVMVKNPINPDLNLWIGAFERLEKAGLTDLAGIHRGFSVYNNPRYRNQPNWEIPIALKEERPDLPIICDPSHISGKRENLLPIAQKAMDLNFEGLIIETHPNPEKAWSDARQQVTPTALREMLSQLTLRRELISEDAQNKMLLMRDKISGLDDKIFELLTARMLISEEIGVFKRDNDITILQQEHWKKMIATRLSKATDLNLSEAFVREFMDALHQESIRHQTKVMNPNLGD
ncbi:3-deoxy-D-arabinoheptulosonate-7-phosphate synthase [Lishizhenia tianjinensis]|uniref:chorismate mutase n=1 Tax=Lishizhenia tianjinensis TaxID=477690 RepID=A0A1I6YQE0_9FLAO|nr:chorismate mutase [Lishizhenia tianjinensis]SFT52645.1 3-deoxy-D-arabinoheptulosonate-7-phosphate synthase [Lishizhenia tianjinensis]